MTGSGEKENVDEGAERLATREYWDSVHRDERDHGPLEMPGAGGGELAGDSPAGARRGLLDNHAWEVFWRVLLARHLPRRPGLRALEIGSAPGFNALRFRDLLGYQPYGLEYSEDGVALNREVFRRHGLAPEQVIPGDLFDPEVRRPWRESFGVVTSFGFIEHFTDPREALVCHLELLEPGGILVVTVPNLRGLYGPGLRLLAPGVFETHNLEVMKPPVLRRVCEECGVETLYCGYVGTVNLGVISARSGRLRQACRKGLHRLQAGLNLLLNTASPDRWLPSSGFSPYVAYIGRKPGGASAPTA